MVFYRCPFYIKKEAYKLLITGEKFDFSKGLAFSPKPKWGEHNYYAPPEMSAKLPIIPLEISKITKLNLANCRYPSLPNELEKYQDLIHLDLSDNYLASLSTVLEKLQNLESIDLSKNRLKRFPEVLLKLPKLKKIDLRGNEFSKVEVSLEEVEILV